MTKPYFDTALPRVFAHRGLATSVPENTLAAFSAAVELGVRYVETDVHGSKDGVAVVSHDPDLTRLAGIKSQVRDYTLAQLGAIELGAGQSFSSLAEALDAFPETRFNIDVKSADAIQPTIDAIKATQAVDRVLVTSFSEERRIATVRGLPGVATSAGAKRFATALNAATFARTTALARALVDIDCVQVPTHYGPLRITTPPIIRRLHAAGVEVHVWTINDAATMHRLLDLGVDGIVTDRADIALDVLADRLL